VRRRPATTAGAEYQDQTFGFGFVLIAWLFAVSTRSQVQAFLFLSRKEEIFREMVRNNDQPTKVALFIDWDNLAISTSADMGGSLPDVPALVGASQRYGEVVVARAYSEWQMTSERLAVYRAGVEPVYAPTFRFESESQAGGSKGKSLADPCMVADCVDFLHLMPEIQVYVLISGDKDMVPVVRLTQLRGKRVIVIGPDLVAAILRDMADEYIPYRSLVDPSTLQAPPPTNNRRRRSDTGRQTRAQSSSSNPRTPPPAVEVEPVRPAAQARQAPAAPTEPAKPPAEESASSTEPAPPPKELTAPVRQVIDKLLGILAEKEAAGRARVRSTNLRDLMHGRHSGFHEKNLGFRRFKDLLDVAEEHGLIEVKREGPVLWVTALMKVEEPAKPEPAKPEPAQPEPEADQPAATTAPSPDETPAKPQLTPDSVDDRLMDVVRFVAELRTRSRWLTYTYVLTNLTNHLAQSQPDSNVDAEARGSLDRLVKDNAITIDREPREIEVGSSRHRVRMCHLNEDHPLVVAAAEQPMEEKTPAPSVDEQAPQSADEPEPSAADEQPAAAPEPVTQIADEQPEAEKDADTEEDQPDPFTEAASIVRDAVTDKKPYVGAAFVKNRLTKRIGGFDEKARGFKQFKQFLLEVQRRGLVKVKSVGAATRVFPADETNDKAEQPAEDGAAAGASAVETGSEK
jgi:hypothetical protein